MNTLTTKKNPLKRLLAVLLIMVLSVPTFWIGSPFNPGTRAFADTYRLGYDLVAEKSDRTGIFTDSTFLLTVPVEELVIFAGEGEAEERAAAVIQELEQRLALLARAEALPLAIELQSGNTFRVTPTEPLKSNGLYSFKLTSSMGSEVVFAFQTRREFGILGTLPAHQSSGVPIDTGIEVYFTHNGVAGSEEFFIITPNAQGRFETQGNALIFVPTTPLNVGTVYTITVKAGFPLPGTEEVLGSDFSFSFETNPDPETSANPIEGYLVISGGWLEFPTGIRPVLPFDVSLPESLLSDQKADINVDVFRYGSADAFLSALEQSDSVPFWAWWSRQQNVMETEGLAKSFSYTQTVDFSVWSTRFTEFPEILPAGFYLVELSAGSEERPLRAQALLQVTDTAAWFIEDKDTMLFWLNNVGSGLPMTGAEIESTLTGLSGTTNAEGLASLDKSNILAPSGETPEYFKVTAADGSISIVNAGFPDVSMPVSGNASSFRGPDSPTPISADISIPRMPGFPTLEEGNYWRVSGLDRTLYKPSDTVNFWGFARHRLSGLSPESVTVEISQGGWLHPWLDARASFWLPTLQRPLMTETVAVNNGFWNDSIVLPALEPGHYTLAVRQGDDTISISSFAVENYVKPAWSIFVETDQTALFPGESATFTVTASFFDGTPVANQNIRYTIQEADKSLTGEGRTNAQGEFKVQYQARYIDGHQGELWTSFHVYAELPEVGEVSAYASLRVFMNDIIAEALSQVVNSDGSPAADNDEARIGRVTIAANKANLAPLNDDDTNNDFQLKGSPAAGVELSATATVITWDRVRTGETYDFVNKVVVPQFEYRENRQTAATGSVTTGADGKATWDFPIPAGAVGHYTIEITLRDSNNRPMTLHSWMSPPASFRPEAGSSVWYSLTTDKSHYRDGDLVRATVERSDAGQISGRTLFVASWNGILSFSIARNPVYETVFKEAMAPNLTLDGVVFDGRRYHAVQTTILYDSEEKRIDFKIITDKENYRPGDTVTLTINAKDAGGNPVPATINVVLVDEALFKLSDQTVDILGSLYSWMDNGIIRRSGSSAFPNMGPARGIGALESAVAEESMLPPSPVLDMSKSDAVDGAQEAYVIRSDFRDTAFFAMATLDETGTGELTFTLPDNITDWRITVSGVSEALHGGNGLASTIVSLPFFLQETLSPTYLTGDEPLIGLTAYGTHLTEGQDVTFTVSSPELPGLNAVVVGKAFERSHIPVGQLSAGTYTFIFKARSASGLTDALERTVTVVDTYREMKKTVEAQLTNGMVIPAGTDGLTRITVSDPARASLIQTLNNLAWQSGLRLDQKLVSASAVRWLIELTDSSKTANGVSPRPFEDSFDEPETVDTGIFRRPDGGYGILPYAESDLRMTALLTSLLEENGSTDSLRTWLYSQALTGLVPPASALYGLAVLGEPVLLELQAAYENKDQGAEDILFIVLGLAELGELPLARSLWNAEIEPLLSRDEPYVRIQAQGNSSDDNLRLTALASVAAAKLLLDEADGLRNWVRDNGSKNVYTGIEDLLWAKERFQSLPSETLSFTWTYQGRPTKEVLENGEVAFITIPSLYASVLIISDVTGDGRLNSTFNAPAELISNTRDITLVRRYFNQNTGVETNSFSMNDVVRVQLEWSISPNAADSVYEISDWLPSGLAPIANPWQYGIRPADGFWYRDFDGQQVNFVVGRDWKLNQTIVYYARVTSPGVYTAEGSLMRGSTVRNSLVAIESDSITIRTE